MNEVLAEVEPSSDYLKVEMVVTARCLDCDNTDCEHALTKAKEIGDRLMRFARLKDAVVEAAKEWYRVKLELTHAQRSLEEELNTPIVLAEAVAALNVFEVERGMKP